MDGKKALNEPNASNAFFRVSAVFLAAVMLLAFTAGCLERGAQKEIDGASDIEINVFSALSEAGKMARAVQTEEFSTKIEDAGGMLDEAAAVLESGDLKVLDYQKPALASLGKISGIQRNITKAETSFASGSEKIKRMNSAFNSSSFSDASKACTDAKTDISAAKKLFDPAKNALAGINSTTIPKNLAEKLSKYKAELDELASLTDGYVFGLNGMDNFIAGKSNMLSADGAVATKNPARYSYARMNYEAAVEKFKAAETEFNRAGKVSKANDTLMNGVQLAGTASKMKMASAYMMEGIDSAESGDYDSMQKMFDKANSLVGQQP